jgi:hypothetical protein
VVRKKAENHQGHEVPRRKKVSRSGQPHKFLSFPGLFPG